jgi:mediator of RNA polymerase II transcription subunit 14
LTDDSFYRHALDFRLMAGKKVVILDGSYSIFGSIAQDTDLDARERDLASEANGTIGVLQAIPDFHKVIEDVVHDITLDCWGAESQSVALIDVGLVCHVSVAGKVGLAVFRRVVDRLNGVR